MHKAALITGIVLFIIGLALLIGGWVLKSKQAPGTQLSSVTLGLLIGGGVIAVIGIILMIVGAVAKSPEETAMGARVVQPVSVPVYHH